jgi:hypothetical protein
MRHWREEAYSCVVVDIDYAERACTKTTLDQLVIDASVGAVEGSSELVVHQVLPRDGQAENVQAVVLDEVLHLAVVASAYRMA